MPGRELISDEVAESRGFAGAAAARRREVLRETVRAFREADPPGWYHRLARGNLERWRDDAEARAPTVRVLPGDWGEVAHAMTRRYGRCFAVLNMANAHVPGGAYVEGAVAQEENIFRRTDCHFAVTEAEYDRRADRYRPEMTRLLSGRDGVVYLDVETPRVCIRGPEDRAAPDLGYRWLPDSEVFPFWELRCAAQDLRGGRPFDEVDARRRIAAQLDTLVHHGVRHAVLGASGCGAFRNPTRRVAELYREEIERRRTSFHVLVFAIFSAGYGPSNFEPFAEVFSGSLPSR
jgi:hypothetical protein